MHRILYIGKAGGDDGINGRINGHEKWNEWKRLVGKGRELCFSYADVNTAYNERVEAAYINAHKPPLNTEYKNRFPYDQTTINGTGDRQALLDRNFTVEWH